MSEINQLEQIAAAETGRDYARERRETAEAMRLCDEMEALDAERAADDVEELLAAWCDPLTGLPLIGESPRYRTIEQLEYMAWVASPAGEATRRRVHPRFHERLSRGAG